jgi:hypothetical protein
MGPLRIGEQVQSVKHRRKKKKKKKKEERRRKKKKFFFVSEKEKFWVKYDNKKECVLFFNCK